MLVALGLKEKEEALAVLLPKAGGGLVELLVELETAPKLKADVGAAAVGAVGFDPAEKLKLLDLRGLAAADADGLVVVLALPIPPKANGLLAGVVEGAAAAEAPNENGAEVGEVTLG